MCSPCGSADDQVDRDFEKFDTEALPELARLFVGKTGICDHQWTSQSQICRIFETQVVREEQGSYIRAWAYMRRAAAPTEVIADIEAGIKKERSAWAAPWAGRSAPCAGEEYGTCGHRKGEHYDRTLCCAILEGGPWTLTGIFPCGGACPAGGGRAENRRTGRFPEGTGGPARA